jgi:hypothetical protein
LTFARSAGVAFFSMGRNLLSACKTAFTLAAALLSSRFKALMDAAFVLFFAT